MILIRNPNINIYCAAISSLISQIISFLICYMVLRKSIKLKLNFKNNILKPFLAGSLMAIIMIIIQNLLQGNVNNIILTISNVIVGGIVYLLAISVLKILSKDEILLFPMGDKIYSILKVLRIYS